MVLVVFLAVSVSEMPEAKAVMQIRCSSVTVGYGDYTSVQDVCYWVYSGGSGGGRGYAGGFRDVGGGGGGRRFAPNVGTIIAEDNPYNETRATCRSDYLTRYMHAQSDAKVTLGIGQAIQGRFYRPNTKVKITYDDGGTEIWLASGGAGTVALIDNKEGTLKCPVNNT